jgi:hypothetical protein
MKISADLGGLPLLAFHRSYALVIDQFHIPPFIDLLFALQSPRAFDRLRAAEAAPPMNVRYRG